MSRSTISTGRPHQAKVATWVRRRLVDASGGSFDAGTRRVEQDGVVLADGVGLGKTWEALAASALILAERAKERRWGGRRKNVRRQRARVLVLCPPGLVSKWSREIRDPYGFSAHLHRWARSRKRRKFVLGTLTEPFEIHRQSDLAGLRPGSQQGRRIVMPAGTYIVNWNVVRKRVRSGRSRLAVLRSQSWDVLIVDEAHHHEAREAIETVDAWAEETGERLLLTATPFQLEPREIHQVLDAVLFKSYGAHRVMSRPPVRDFAAALKQFFEGGEPPGTRLKRDAEATLRQVIVRSAVPTLGRQYHSLGARGETISISPPYDMDESSLRAIHRHLTQPTKEFEAWYLRRRLHLADGPRTFVPTKLRQALSTPGQARAAGGYRHDALESPRLDAIQAWARRQAEADFRQAAHDGMPRKILVFTSFLGRAARDLQESLSEAVTDAWDAVKKEQSWRRMSGNASRGVELVKARVNRVIESDEGLRSSADAHAVLAALDEILDRQDAGLVGDLFGQGRFQRLVADDLERRLGALATVLSADRRDKQWERLRRAERRSVHAAIKAIGKAELVRTYTGHDDRRDRDAAGEAFRSPLAPWCLVASNVGSEGIDLHTYSAHLVHFDIEWNPARMEQREGRIDRLGRKLREPVNVYYVLVRGTYDERMLHQLVARQRWHSVLLGRPAARLARDSSGNLDAPLLDPGVARKFTLDLTPKR